MAPRIKVASISGFPEWLPAQRLLEQRLIATIRQKFELYGFTPIETPAVERMDVLLAKGGIGRQIYTLGRPEEGGGKSDAELGLHFDLTVPLARYVAQHQGKLTFPFRRYQIQKVWRGERAQKGRFREFYQCDIDVIGRGSLDPMHEAEMPCVINAAFEACGFPDFEIWVSNRQILQDLLGAGAEAQLPAVLRVVDKSMRDGIDRTRARLAEEGLEADRIDPVMNLIQCATIDEGRAVLESAHAQTTGVDALAATIDQAVSLGMPPDRIRPGFAIARGLDYYTGVVYETFIKGKQAWGSICSGGRYDDLTGAFTSQPFPGIGLSIGLSRLFDLLVRENLLEAATQGPTDVLVTTQDRERFMTDYVRIAAHLRAADIPTEVYYDKAKLGAQFGYASDKGIALAIVAGESEIEAHTAAVKDLAAREQETVEQDRLVEYVKAKLALRRDG